MNKPIQDWISFLFTPSPMAKLAKDILGEDWLERCQRMRMGRRVMKASKFIEQLQELIAKHGDKNLMFMDCFTNLESGLSNPIYDKKRKKIVYEIYEIDS